MAPVPDFVRQGMTVSVTVQTGQRARALVVPNDALSALDGNRAELWVVRQGRAGRQPVQLGLRGLTQTEIIQGLQAGDWVLTDPPATLAPGDRVRVTPATAAVDSPSRNELPAKLD